MADKTKGGKFGPLRKHPTETLKSTPGIFDKPKPSSG